MEGFHLNARPPGGFNPAFNLHCTGVRALNIELNGRNIQRMAKGNHRPGLLHGHRPGNHRCLDDGAFLG